MEELRELISRVARATSPVLIQGETGSGKEGVARAIHQQSDRNEAPFVIVDCAALTSVLESPLAPGLHGSVRKYRGLPVEAEGGTLFLDEIGDLPPALQGKFMAALQDDLLPEGWGITTRASTVRCVAADHRDLQGLVRDGKFRQDLYYRLNVLTVFVPSLRERPEDILPLIEFFRARQVGAASAGGPSFTLTAEALQVLQSHAWPGNVRELENLVERLAVMGPTGATVDVPAVRAALARRAPLDPLHALARAQVPLHEVERRYVTAVLGQTDGDKSKAAAILGVDLPRLQRNLP